MDIVHEIWDEKVYSDGKVLGKARNGVVVDVGAHIGMFALHAATQLHASLVACFEPVTDNFVLLQRNVALNGLQNVRTLRAGIGGASGYRRMILDPTNLGGSVMDEPVGGDASAAGETVRVLTLRDALLECDVPSFQLLKMDCEGAEMEILEGVSSELLTTTEAIMLEYHLQQYGAVGLQRILKRLAELGFAPRVRPSTDSLGLILATRLEEGG